MDLADIWELRFGQWKPNKFLPVPNIRGTKANWIVFPYEPWRCECSEHHFNEEANRTNCPEDNGFNWLNTWVLDDGEPYQRTDPESPYQDGAAPFGITPSPAVVIFESAQPINERRYHIAQYSPVMRLKDHFKAFFKTRPLTERNEVGIWDFNGGRTNYQLSPDEIQDLKDTGSIPITPPIPPIRSAAQWKPNKIIAPVNVPKATWLAFPYGEPCSCSKHDYAHDGLPAEPYHSLRPNRRKIDCKQNADAFWLNIWVLNDARKYTRGLAYDEIRPEPLLAIYEANDAIDSRAYHIEDTTTKDINHQQFSDFLREFFKTRPVTEANSITYFKSDTAIERNYRHHMVPYEPFKALLDGECDRIDAAWWRN